MDVAVKSALGAVKAVVIRELIEPMLPVTAELTLAPNNLYTDRVLKRPLTPFTV